MNSPDFNLTLSSPASVDLKIKTRKNSMSFNAATLSRFPNINKTEMKKKHLNLDMFPVPEAKIFSARK